jgi:hypothetical protein
MDVPFSMLSFLWSRSMFDGACSNWCDDDNFSHCVLEGTAELLVLVVRLQWLERHRSNHAHPYEKQQEKAKRRTEKGKKIARLM